MQREVALLGIDRLRGAEAVMAFEERAYACDVPGRYLELENDDDWCLDDDGYPRFFDLVLNASLE